MRVVLRLNLGSIKYSSAINIPAPFKSGPGTFSLLNIPTPWLLATFFLLLSLYLLFAPSQGGSSSHSNTNSSSVLPFHSSSGFNPFPAPPTTPTNTILKPHVYSPPDSPTRHKSRRPYGATHGRRWSTGKDLVREMEELRELLEEGESSEEKEEKEYFDEKASYQSYNASSTGQLSPRRGSREDES